MPYVKTKTLLKESRIQVREYDDYKEYLVSLAVKSNKTMSELISDALRKVHPMPKNWKPKQS